MPTFAEYTTVAKVKTYKDTQSSVSDGLILDMIRQTSREIESIANRFFYPRVVTEYYDTPRNSSWDLVFSHDMLEITTLTNGDGTTITASNYKLYPLNDTPKLKLALLPYQTMWLMNSNGFPNGAITLTGIAGYHNDYANAWQTVTALATATDEFGTSVSVPTGLINAGDLLQIGTEFVYVVSVAAGSPNDTLTVVRGVNGSTAIYHLISTNVTRWDCGQDIEMLTRRAATAYTKLRSNPIAESVSVDGINFSTPKDVIKWIDSQLTVMGKIRMGLA